MDIRPEFLGLVLACALVTAVPRVLPLVVLSRLRLPAWLVDWLGYVPIADDDLFRKETLVSAGLATLYHRLGFYFDQSKSPPGACIPLGFATYLRWTHLPPSSLLPPALGGINDSTLARLQEFAERDALPSLTSLFSVKPKGFEVKEGRDTLYGMAVLLTEFLMNRAPKASAEYYQLLKKYAATSSPVKEFSPSLFFEHYRKPIGDAAAIESELRAWLAEKSRPFNETKRLAAMKQRDR